MSRINIFEGVRNVRRIDDVQVKDIGLLPCYEVTEPSAEEWTRQAMIVNRKAFEREHGRPAASDDEVMAFAYRMAYGENWAHEPARHYEALEQQQQAAG